MIYSKVITIPVAAVVLAAISLASPVQVPEVRQINATPFDASSFSRRQAHSLHRRDYASITGTTSCRDLTFDDLKGMNDDQMTRMNTYLNNRFPNVGYDINSGDNNIRKFAAMLRSNSLNDLDIHALTDDEYNTYPFLTRAKICLDASQASTAGYQEDSANCFSSSIKTYGTLSDTGEVTIEATQGYTLSATVSTETENTVGGSLSVTVGADFEVASVEATVEVHYDTSTTNGQENTTEKSSETTVSLTLNPPPGYSCYLEVAQQTCPGSMDIHIPLTIPGGNGAIMLHHGDKTYDSYSNGEHYYSFMYADDIAAVFGDQGLNQHISASVGSTGQYKEYCQPQGSGDTGGGSDTPTPSTAYIPQLTCPKVLKVVPSSCSYTAEDYLGLGMITGDQANWAYNLAEFTQYPALGSALKYGQSTVTFNVTTPYHSTACESLVQVVPPWGPTFSPLESVLSFPQDGSSLVTRYDVGYISQCDLQQHGSCSISNIQSLYTPDFHYTQTSTPGNPLQSFTFSGTWPEYDRFTFTIACTDPYGNSGTSQVFQEAYRGDIATATLTANTATKTFHSTTQYLYTSVKTFLTSVVIPATTDILRTDTLFTGTSYTSTRTLTNYGAPKFLKTTWTTATPTSTAKITETAFSTVTPALVTVTSTKTKHPTATITETTKVGVQTVLATLTEPHTTTVTVKAQPTKCSKKGNRNEIVEARKVIGTTTVIDGQDTITVIDYTDVATTLVDATTTSTDLTDIALSTSATTSTIYDPIHTAIASGIKFDISTLVLDSFTVTKTSTRTHTTTTSTTSTKTKPTTVKTPTSTTVRTRTKSTTVTSDVTQARKTTTKFVKTVQGTATVTATVTKPAACTP